MRSLLLLRADEKTAMFAAEGMDPEKVPAVERAVSGCCSGDGTTKLIAYQKRMNPRLNSANNQLLYHHHADKIRPSL